jgi:hypothetical protein
MKDRNSNELKYLIRSTGSSMGVLFLDQETPAQGRGFIE